MTLPLFSCNKDTDPHEKNHIMSHHPFPSHEHVSSDDEDEAFVQAALHLEGKGAVLPAPRKRSAREVERDELIAKQFKHHRRDRPDFIVTSSRVDETTYRVNSISNEPSAVTADGAAEGATDVVSHAPPAVAPEPEDAFGPLPMLPRFNEKQKQKYTICANRRLMLNALAEFDADRRSGMYTGPAPFRGRGRGGGRGYRGGGASWNRGGGSYGDAANSTVENSGGFEES